MLTFIMENLGTIIITALLIAIVMCIIASMIRDKRQGRLSCGGNCAHCKMCTGHSQYRSEKTHQ